MPSFVHHSSAALCYYNSYMKQDDTHFLFSTVLPLSFLIKSFQLIHVLLRKLVNFVNYLYYHSKIIIFLSLHSLNCFSLMFGERISKSM